MVVKAEEKNALRDQRNLRRSLFRNKNGERVLTQRYKKGEDGEEGERYK